MSQEYELCAPPCWDKEHSYAEVTVRVNGAGRSALLRAPATRLLSYLVEPELASRYTSFGHATTRFGIMAEGFNAQENYSWGRYRLYVE